MKKCSLCKFESLDLVQHAKSEWHTYNLRRETTGLSSISYEDFKAKQNELILKNTIAIPKDYNCCNKVFKSIKTYENHLKSKKHTEKSVKLNESKESEEETSNEEEVIEEEVIEEGMIVEYEEESDIDEEVDEVLTELDCIFCNQHSTTVEKNVKHMSEMHRFKLPYPEYVCDLEGLVVYLWSLIGEYKVCIQCNKQFDDRQSVRNHMMDLNHIQLYFHLESNGDDLCDYYNDVPKPMSNLNELSDDNQIEAVLPSGKKIGNRNMNVYFKQNLNGLSNTNHLAITSGVEKAKMSVMTSGRYGQLAKPVTMTPQMKKSKILESRNTQLRASRFSNYQAHFRLQILM